MHTMTGNNQKPISKFGSHYPVGKKSFHLHKLTMTRFHKLKLQVAALLALLVMTHSGWPQSSTQNVDPKEVLQKMRQTKEAAKKQREAAIQKLKAKIAPLMEYSIEELQLALTTKVTTTYRAAKIIADDEDHTYLGQIDDEFSSDSTNTARTAASTAPRASRTSTGDSVASIQCIAPSISIHPLHR